MRKVDIALIPGLLEQTEKIQAREFGLKKWYDYLEVVGLGEFAVITGYTVDEFKEIYKEYTRLVQEYYTSFKSDRYERYCPLKARIGLAFEGGLKLGNFYFQKWDNWSIDDCTTINILQGDYFTVGKKKQIQFLPCEEVIKSLIILYKINQDEFDQERRLKTEPLFPVDNDVLSALKALHY